MRPIGMADAVRDHPGRMHERAPRAFTFAGTPRERRVLVRKPRVDAERVLDLRMDQLSPLVERSEFFAEPVHALAASQRERGCPQSALSQTAEIRQTRKAAKVLVGDRAEYRTRFPEQSKSQRRAADFEHRVAGGESPRPFRARRDAAMLC